jgi:Zn-dependent M28 family amino/carboxypeptidase
VCRDIRHYPPPDKTRKEYTKPVPVTLEKLRKIDDDLSRLLTEVSGDAIKSNVEKLSSYHTRHSKSEYIGEVAEWINNEFKKIGYNDIFLHSYTENIDGKNYDLKNVICKKEGNNKACVLICAHYDSRMEDLSDFRSRSPGANDNASGVSSILEIARILHRKDLEYSLQFALFSGEEQGLLGSKHYAKFVKDNNVDVYRLINLDMIGYPKLNPGIVIVERDNHTEAEHNQVRENDEESIEFGKIMAGVSSYANLQISLDSIWNSDYEPFEAEGYIVVGAYDGSADEKHNPHYHSRTDTASLIDWNYLAAVTKMVLGTVAEVARKH